MTAILAVALREIRERRILLAGGLYTAIAPFVFDRLIPPTRGQGLHIALALTIFSPWAVALMLGSSVIGRDLAERRLGFYFSRPLSALAIWSGKMLGALTLTFATLAIGIVDVLLLAPHPMRRPDDLTPLFLGTALLLFFLSASAVVSGALRSRWSLVLVDITSIALVVGAAFWVSLRMVDAGAGPVALVIGSRMFVPAIPFLLAATAAQVVVGRADPRRGHLVLSVVAAGGLLACVVGFALYCRWLTGPAPEDLRSSVIEAAPTGDWLILQGSAPRMDVIDLGDPMYAAIARDAGGEIYLPGFMVDAATGRYIALGGTRRGPVWSRDGRRAAWCVQHLGYCELAAARVDLGGAPSVRRIEASGADPLALSVDGRLLARYREALTLIDVETGQTIGRGGDGSASFAAFLADGKVRLLSGSRRGTEWHVSDWDARSGRIEERGRLASKEGMQARLSPDGERLVASDERGLGLFTVDGQRVATLIDGWAGRNHAYALLSDGGVVAIEETGPGLRLQVFAPDGNRPASGIISGSFPLHLGGEIAAGTLAIGIDRRDRGGARETVFVDTKNGAVVRREADLLPTARWQGEVPQPGSAGTRLFRDSGGALIRLDPTTGDRRVLVAGRRSVEG